MRHAFTRLEDCQSTLWSTNAISSSTGLELTLPRQRALVPLIKVLHFSVRRLAPVMRAMLDSETPEGS